MAREWQSVQERLTRLEDWRHDVITPRELGAIEARLRAVEIEIQRLREWRHEMVEDIIPLQLKLDETKETLEKFVMKLDALNARHAETRRDESATSLTRWDARIVVASFAAGAGVCITLLKIFGKM